MTSRYLVTGAQGFVGRFVVADLLKSEAPLQILGLGRSSASQHHFTHSVTWSGRKLIAPLPAELPESIFTDERYDYATADLQDRDRLSLLLMGFRPHRIIHLASGLWGDPADKLFRCNVEGTINLLEAIGQSSCTVDRVVIGSSGGVYGSVEKLPIAETSPTSPLHMYSVSKLAAELAAGVVARNYDLPIVIARIFNIVGPGQDERHVCGRFLTQLAAIAAGEQPPHLQVGTLSTTRDLIDVRDTARAIRVLCEHGQRDEVYNVASGRETMIRDVLNQCLNITSLHHVRIEESQNRQVDLPRHYADIGKISKLGWNPGYSLADSLRDLHQYYSECVAPLAADRKVDLNA